MHVNLDLCTPVTIYMLKDPRDGACRYVGRTQQKLNVRLNVHVGDAKHGANNKAKGAWIRELLALGLRPVAEVLEVCEAHLGNGRENHWIETFRAQGASLFNVKAKAPRPPCAACVALKRLCIGGHWPHVEPMPMPPGWTVEEWES